MEVAHPHPLPRRTNNKKPPCPPAKTIQHTNSNLLREATFTSLREGATLDVGEWFKPKNGRTPGVIVSVAHLDDEERALVLGVLLGKVVKNLALQPRWAMSLLRGPMTRSEIQRAVAMRRGEVEADEVRQRVVRVTAAGEEADLLEGPLTSTSTSSATTLWRQSLQTADL